MASLKLHWPKPKFAAYKFQITKLTVKGDYSSAFLQALEKARRLASGNDGWCAFQTSAKMGK